MTARAADIVEQAMTALADRRPLFHSEADFQHALAWEIQTANPSAAIRLEKRLAIEPTVQLDILVQLDGQRLGVELKYLRRGMTAEVDDEKFVLSTGADDHGRYYAIEDCARLERLITEDLLDSGAMVLLTNVANVWEQPASTRAVLYEAFRMHDGHTLTGTMEWGTGGASGGRPSTGVVTLAGSYPLAWRDYSVVDGHPLRYLLVAIG